jgi:hypothetical protein
MCRAYRVLLVWFFVSCCSCLYVLYQAIEFLLLVYLENMDVRGGVTSVHTAFTGAQRVDLVLETNSSGGNTRSRALRAMTAPSSTATACTPLKRYHPWLNPPQGDGAICTASQNQLLVERRKRTETHAHHGTHVYTHTHTHSRSELTQPRRTYRRSVPNPLQAQTDALTVYLKRAGVRQALHVPTHQSQCNQAVLAAHPFAQCVIVNGHTATTAYTAHASASAFVSAGGRELLASSLTRPPLHGALFSLELSRQLVGSRRLPVRHCTETIIMRHT